MIVSSPLAVAGKIVMTLALVTGVAKLSLSNSTIKNDIVATQANIKTLKQETNAKKQVKYHESLGRNINLVQSNPCSSVYKIVLKIKNEMF